MTSKYFKPYLELLGQSTQQMRKKGLIKPKARNSEDNPSDDNGKVMTGEAFKYFLK